MAMLQIAVSDPDLVVSCMGILYGELRRTDFVPVGEEKDDAMNEDESRGAEEPKANDDYEPTSPASSSMSVDGVKVLESSMTEDMVPLPSLTVIHAVLHCCRFLTIKFV